MTPLEVAVRELEEGNYDAVVDIATTELNKNEPINPEFLLIRSKAYTCLKKYDEAVHDCDEAAKFESTSESAALFKKNNLCEKASSKPEKTTAKPEMNSQQPRVDWYQTQSTTYVMLYKKGLDPNIPVEITPCKLSIDGPDFKWNQSVGAIIPEESSYTISHYKVEFSLKKAAPRNWNSLAKGAEMSSSPEDLQIKSAPAAPTKPSGLQYSKWDNLEDSDPESGEAMDLFQKLYSQADDNTKKAMMKSYTESNGTVLSTDWNEVSKGKVDVAAPKDMEPKKW